MINLKSNLLFQSVNLKFNLLFQYFNLKSILLFLLSHPIMIYRNLKTAK